MRALLVVALLAATAQADEACRGERITTANYERYIDESKTEEDRSYYKRGLEQAVRKLTACLAAVAATQAEHDKAQRERVEALAAKAAAEKERADLRAALLADVGAMTGFISARICDAKDTRRVSLEDIANEHKYARVGGVINKAKLYELQQMVRFADETIAKSTAELRRLKARTLPCSHATVRQLMLCVQPTGADVCNTQRMRVGMDIIHERVD